MSVRTKRRGTQVQTIIWIMAILALVGALLFLLAGQFEAVAEWSRGLVE